MVLVPAGTGTPDDAANNDTDPFPGSGGVREYRDELFGIVISDISDSAAVMTADFTIPESINGWRVLDSGVESDLCAVRFTDENTGWAAGEDGIIIHTSDGGENWTVQAAAAGEDLAALCFVDSATGWAAGAAGTILATTDGGNTWIDRYTGTWEDLNSVSFVDRSAGWALSSEGTLLSTVDGGVTWSSAALSTSGEAAVEVEFASANTGFIAGAETTLFCSGDSGGSWTAWTGLGSTSIEISGLCVRADNDLWLVGSFDRGYLFWVWEGHTTYLTAADYKKLIDVDFCSDLGVAVGDRLMVMDLDSSLGYGLNLFSLGSGSSDHIMDDMEWVAPQEWSDQLENASLAVDVVSGDVAYVVGENGLILRYDRESSWTAGTSVPIGGGIYQPIGKFEVEYDIDGLRKREYDPAVTMSDRFRFLLDNGPVVDWPLPTRYSPAQLNSLSPQFPIRQILGN